MSAQRNQWLNGKSIAAALGCGEWIIYGVKKANKIFAGRGLEPLIFTGRLSTPARVAAWLEAHPDFVANQVLAAKRGQRQPQQRQAA